MTAKPSAVDDKALNISNMPALYIKNI